jgi:hypothetical protein
VETFTCNAPEGSRCTRRICWSLSHMGVDRCIFPNALGHLIPTLAFEQRLGHYDGNFFNRGRAFLI